MLKTKFKTELTAIPFTDPGDYVSHKNNGRIRAADGRRTAEQNRRTLILDSIEDFDRELCLAAKERINKRMEQLLERDFSLCGGTAKKDEEVVDFADTSASALPNSEESVPPITAGILAERQFQHCIGIIDTYLESTVTEIEKPCHCSIVVHQKLALRLSDHYSVGGYYFGVTPKKDDMAEFKISFW